MDICLFLTSYFSVLQVRNIISISLKTNNTEILLNFCIIFIDQSFKIKSLLFCAILGIVEKNLLVHFKRFMSWNVSIYYFLYTLKPV